MLACLFVSIHAPQGGDAIDAINQQNSDLTNLINSSFICDPLAYIPDCNLNSDYPSGVYYFSIDSMHTPIPTTYGMLKHFVTCDGAWLFQEATLVNNQIYVRSNIDAGGWSEWEKK